MKSFYLHIAIWINKILFVLQRRLSERILGLLIKKNLLWTWRGNVGRKPLSRFDGPKMILIVFMVCWGIAMFLVLGVIAYLPILMAQPPNPQD